MVSGAATCLRFLTAIAVVLGLLNVQKAQSDSMTSKELSHFRGILETHQAELGNALDSREVIAIGPASDLFDQIQSAAERDFAVGYLERESTRLREVRAALQRIKTGKFGLCLDCDEAVGLKRLAALPWATSCIACRQLADRQQSLPTGEEVEPRVLAID